MSRGLTKLQAEVMDRIFSGEDEDKALAAAEISQSIYQRWLRSEKWQEEFERRVEACQRQKNLFVTPPNNTTSRQNRYSKPNI